VQTPDQANAVAELPARTGFPQVKMEVHVLACGHIFRAAADPFDKPASIKARADQPSGMMPFHPGLPAGPGIGLDEACDPPEDCIEGFVPDQHRHQIPMPAGHRSS
jgi:hypothetical protein